jgi:RNA polymerase sigma-70 factor (ECF subfamily)
MTTKEEKYPEYPLIRRALDKDQRAFREILERYENGVRAVVRKMVFDPKESEDLVQEAFIKAFNSIHSFNFEFSFATWLYKIAANNCIDFLRKRKLKTYSYDKPIQQKDGETQQEFADSVPNVEKNMIQEETSSQIKQAILDLPEKYRIVIVMRHQEEKSYEEISEFLDIPLGTVKARIFRAREMLNKKLRKVLVN